jgi:diguanylate cyclase (GGDEF)-like protein/PAS domain S-box-containing protein
MATVRAFLRRLGLAQDGGPYSFDHQAAETFPIPILFADRDGRLIPANAAAAPLGDQAHEGHLAAMSGAVGRALSGGKPVEVVVVPAPAGPMLYELTVLGREGGGALVFAKDVTLQTNLRSTLVESRQRYKDLVEISSDFAWELGPDGCFTFVSPRGALGRTADELIGRPPADFLVDRDGVDGLLPFTADQPVEDVLVWMRHADGGALCMQTSSAPLLDGDGRRRGGRGVCHDVTPDREREAALARANNRELVLAYLLRTIRDVVDPSEMLNRAAEAIAHALGGSGCQILRGRESQTTQAVLFGRPLGLDAVVAALSSAEIHEGWIEGCPVLGKATHYGREANGAVLVWRDRGGAPWSEDDRLLLGDVSDQIGIANEQIANHERILLLSRTDSLTGLFNRRAFFEELSRRMRRAAVGGSSAALIYLDLDYFKQVNDLYGHKRGDEALLTVRDMLLRHTRPTDLAARLGGDEFAVWLEGADERIAVARCQEIIDAAATLAGFSPDARHPLAVSLGVAIYDPAVGEELNDFLARADGAMYLVKHDLVTHFHIAAPAGTACRNGATA